MARERVGFIGLGIMGSRMAANLAAAGYELTVWNRTAGGCCGKEAARRVSTLFAFFFPKSECFLISVNLKSTLVNSSAIPSFL